MAFDVEESGLLDGLEGSARSQRAELVEWLLEQGVSESEIADSVQPMLLASRKLLGAGPELVSAHQIAERAGIDGELLGRLLRASGVPRVEDPDEPAYQEVDVTSAEYAQKFVELGISGDQVVRVFQVLTEGLTRTADVMRYAGLEAMSQPGATELDIAQRSAEMMRQIGPLLDPMIAHMMRVRLLHVLETEAVDAGERAAGLPLPGARDATIAFADLVGFTRLGEAVPPEDLEHLAHQLTDLAREVADAPVRYVKSIGDEVMLVSNDAAAMLAAMLALQDATAGIEDFPRLRTGVASGPVLNRGGDWFGSPVNLASRVTSAARPGAILVAESTREAIGEDDRFSWSFAGSRHLKGISGEVKLFRARAAKSDAADDGES